MTLELAVLAPALLVLVSLVILAGRLEVASGVVEQAAAAAARSASLARDPATAQQDATAVARTELAARGLRCTGVRVDLDLHGFAVPVGQPAQVAARVTCTLSLSGLGPVPGLPGTKTLTARAVSVLDEYRARTDP